MPVNLLNEKDLNQYLADIVYHGQQMETFTKGEFKSPAFVRQNKDAIVRSMILQWVKHRLRSYLTSDEQRQQNFLVPVKADQPNLPSWAANCINEGKEVFNFKAEKMPARLVEQISSVRDYLYSAADNYVNKSLVKAEQDQQEPHLRIDYLKTGNQWTTFENTLHLAQEWHELMAQKAEQQERNLQMYQASLSGTKTVMDLDNGMTMVELTTPEALDYESKYMGHCVGDGGYDSAVKKGSTKIYSLRDQDGQPHATIEVRVNEETGKKEIYQCKGKGNKAPIALYRAYLQKFVIKQEFELKHDTANIGLIKQYDEKTRKQQYYDIYHLPKNFVVEGDLDYGGSGLTELPDLSTITVKGDFNCHENQLTSLKGAPQKVGGSFDCDNNQLSSLEGAPQKVGGFFHCAYNQLTSLNGAPREVSGHFFCHHNQLTSLEGAPQEVGDNFYCSYNQLTSLKGAPQEVGGGFSCAENQLISLEGAPQKVGGDFYCRKNQLTSLEGAPQEVGGFFDCAYNQLTSLNGAPQNVGGHFDCDENQLTSLNGAPQNVGGYFSCHENQLTSLEGAPQEVGGNFYCSYNQLTSLKGAPQEVGGGFSCTKNQLTSLNGAPQKVGGSFDCDNNQLTSLEGAPQKVGGNFKCYENQLTSLKGAPQEVGGNFSCRKNQLTSLEGAPQKVGGDFDCSYNQLTSLEGAPQKVGGYFSCHENQLTSLEGAPKIKDFFVCDRSIADKYGLPDVRTSYSDLLKAIKHYNAQQSIRSLRNQTTNAPSPIVPQTEQPSLPKNQCAPNIRQFFDSLQSRRS